MARAVIHKTLMTKRSLLPMSKLCSVWQAACKREQRGLAPLGPIGHAVRQLVHAGWTARGPTWLGNAAGDLVDLTTMCPREVKRLFINDVVEATRSRASEKVRLREQISPESWERPW